MGEVVAVVTGETDGEINRTATAGAGRSDNSSRTAKPSTAGAGAGAGTAGTAGTAGAGTAGTAGTAEKEKLSELAILTEDEKTAYNNADEKEKKRILRNAQRRKQYAEKKTSGGGSVRPRKVKGKQQEQKSTIDKASLNLLIAGVSSVIASRPNCEHWLLSESEIDTITTPLAKMLAESESLQNLGEYSNQIALVVACMTVFAPRLMITAQKQKERKKSGITGNITNTNVQSIDRGRKGTSVTEKKNSSHATDNGSNRNTAANGAVNGYGLPWYDSGIC